MKILISCYACSPYHGSEPGMGWNFVKHLSRLHEVHVITEKDEFQEDIERYFRENPSEQNNYHFYYVRRTHWNRMRKIWPPSYYWTYASWQRKALKLSKELDKKENFDIIHQLNMVGFREPGYLWKIEKPIVWGPIGGMHLSPWVLLPHIGFYGMIYYGMRNLINLWQMRTMNRPKLMAKKSDAIIAATQDSKDAILRLWNKNATIIPEVGLSTTNNYEATHRDTKLKIIWSGLHTPAKALNFLLEAISLSKHKEQIELHVLGKGIYTNRWKRLAQDLKINHIIWFGWVERSVAIQVMKEGHLFCITSMADLTSTVLLEAFSYGLPVIAPDSFGFSNAITDNCGIKIPVKSKGQYVSDYAKAIDFIFENEDRRILLSKGSYSRAFDFTWEKKAEIINKIYTEIADKYKQKNNPLK